MTAILGPVTLSPPSWRPTDGGLFSKVSSDSCVEGMSDGPLSVFSVKIVSLDWCSQDQAGSQKGEDCNEFHLD